MECSLTSVTIPNSVTKIGEYAFRSCGSLTSVNIPNSLNTINENTFTSCDKLKTIYNLNPKPQTVKEGAFKYVPQNATIYIPKGSYNDYFLSSDWIYFSDFREMGAFDVALSEQSIELTVGSTATVAATVTKDDDMTIESEEWSSSKPEVATVDNGVITAVAPGVAVIWFTAVDGYGVPHSEKCIVTVSAAPTLVESITLDLNSVEAVEGDEFQLTATVTPDNASDKTVAWSSSDETVATVSAEGLVKVLKEGSCVITAATTDGSNLKAECQVSVFAGIDDILCDTSIPVEIFNLQGVKISTTIEHLPAGLYIVRQGNTVKKVAVK